MMLDDSNWSHKAWMSVVDADLFEHLLLRQASLQRSRPLHVLEWGAGRSTRYFTGLLTSRQSDFYWMSLEYDREFFKKEVAPTMLPGARVTFIEKNSNVPFAAHAKPLPRLDFVVFDHGPLRPYMAEHVEHRHVVMDDYVAFPATTDLQFDVILVDGRKRRRCLLEAAQLLAPGGVVVLHDAWRTYYQCAYSAFRSHRSIGEILWIGTQSDHLHLDTLLNVEKD